MDPVMNEKTKEEDTQLLQTAKETREMQLKQLRRYRALISKEKQMIKSMEFSRNRSATIGNDKRISLSGSPLKQAISVEAINELKTKDDFVDQLMHLRVDDFRKACSMLDLRTIQDAAKKTNPLRSSIGTPDHTQSQQTGFAHGHQRKYSYDPPKSTFKFKCVDVNIEKSNPNPFERSSSLSVENTVHSAGSSPINPSPLSQFSERKKNLSAVRPLWRSCDNLDLYHHDVELKIEDIDIDDNTNLKPKSLDPKIRRSSSPSLQKRMEEAHRRTLRRMKAMRGLESDCLKAKSMIDTYRSTESLKSSSDSLNTISEDPNDRCLRFSRSRINRLDRETKCWSWNVGETLGTIV